MRMTGTNSDSEKVVKKAVWNADWFLGLIVTLVILLTAGSNVMQSLENQAYDIGVSLMPARAANEQVTIIGIDTKSIAKFGNWPWPRSIVADLIKDVSEEKPRAIGVAIDLSGPQNTNGLKFIKRFKKIYAQVDEENLDAEFAIEYEALLQEAEYGLNTDRLLASALRKSQNVVLAIPYRMSGVPLNVSVLPNYISNNTLPDITFPKRDIARYLPGVMHQRSVPVATIINPPLQRFGKVVKSAGHTKTDFDGNQTVRTESLLLGFNKNIFVSFSLMLAAVSEGLTIDDIKIMRTGGIELGDKLIETDEQFNLLPTFYKGKDGEAPFNVVSFYDVYKGKVPAEKFKDKIVLIGLTEGQSVEPVLLPTGDIVSPISFTANTVSNILNGDYNRQPEWVAWAQLLGIFLVASFLMSILSRVRLVTGLAISALLVIIFFNVELMLLMTQGIWIKLMVPTVQLLIGSMLIATKRLFQDSAADWKSETADSNKMLGLTLQSQGQLDMAFEKFRNLPIDNTALDLFYTLGLDYERKRQFAKAGSVFRYIADYNVNFRDTKKRILSNREMEGRIVHGAVGKSAPAGTIVLDNAAIQRPMIGRYEISREIGRGAMGMVYLGEDPKINRTVAVKTLAFSQEFEDDKLEEVKNRFFREAKTAGRLNHPNIVTIYDVGEDQDLAYIAMDFLRGNDLSEYTKPDNLLPLDDVFFIVSKVAEALDYGQSQGVVHRDIKPANVMYEPKKKIVKVTDFGVACLTDVSKTKTGTILGTPSYMSPEQLAGRKVDGRSDLFSLGVMFFQMITGELPFIGDSMANLMYKISNEKHPDVRMFRPELSSCLTKIIDLALQKDVEKRFQSGEIMARAFRKCQEHINNPQKPKR